MAAQRAEYMETRLSQLEQKLLLVRNDMQDQMRNINAQKVQLVDQFNLEFTKHKLMMVEIIEGAKKEFGDIQRDLQELYQECGRAVMEFKDSLDNVETNPSNKGCTTGCLPSKSLVPGVFTDNLEDWGQWQEDMLDYFDHINPGMKEFFKEVEVEV